MEGIARLSHARAKFEARHELVLEASARRSHFALLFEIHTHTRTPPPHGLCSLCRQNIIIVYFKEPHIFFLSSLALLWHTHTHTHTHNHATTLHLFLSLCLLLCCCFFRVSQAEYSCIRLTRRSSSWLGLLLSCGCGGGGDDLCFFASSPSLSSSSSS